MSLSWMGVWRLFLIRSVPQEWFPFHFVQSQSMTGMLLKAQNAIGELSLEIGTTRKGIQYFQKAWPNLMDFLPSNLEDDQDLVKQEGKVHTCRGITSCSRVGCLGCTRRREREAVCDLQAWFFRWAGGRGRADRNALLF